MQKHIISGQEAEKDNEFIGNNINDFEILQTLGKGSYGFVAKVKSKKNDKIYAMKMIDFSLIKDQTEKQLSIDEIQIIKSLNSPHIIKFYDSFNIGERYYILMEYINNGDLKGYITAHQNMKTPVPEKELWQIFYQCMSGLSYIHQNNLIHRDIKPANLFLTDDKVIKIGDFGVSAKRKYNQNYRNNLDQKKGFQKENLMIGTPLYMSPEIFNHQNYGSKVDVYSMGCTFYELCYFSPPRMPFPVVKFVNNQIQIFTDLKDIEPKFNKNMYSPAINNLLSKMIEKDSNKRPSTSEIFKIIKENYNSLFRQNSSIFCIYRCLLSIQKFQERIIKHKSKIEQSKNIPISKSILFLMLNNKNLINNSNNNYYLQSLRDTLTFENPLFYEPGEIEPEDLIEFILKKLHIENNHINNTFTGLWSLDNNQNIFNRQLILNDYMLNLKNYFKSFISNSFFGTFELEKICSICKVKRFYFESFSYLSFDINQAIQYGLNPIDNNFIFNCFQKQLSNIISKDIFCPKCNKKTFHKEKRTIFTFPNNLIISIKYEGKNMEKININYPIQMGLSCQANNNTYKLKGLIKKHINNENKFFYAIYEENQQWFKSDGYIFEVIRSPLVHNTGKVVMLFYTSY